MKALLDKMEIEDLPNSNLREVAEKVGIGVVKELMIKCGPMIVYIPKTFYKTFCRRYIEKNWTGTNVKQLAQDLGVTERTVYRHLNAKL